MRTHLQAFREAFHPYDTNVYPIILVLEIFSNRKQQDNVNYQVVKLIAEADGLRSRVLVTFEANSNGIRLLNKKAIEGIKSHKELLEIVARLYPMDVTTINIYIV